jgi:hypothetical protein
VQELGFAHLHEMRPVPTYSGEYERLNTASMDFGEVKLAGGPPQGVQEANNTGTSPPNGIPTVPSQNQQNNQTSTDNQEVEDNNSPVVGPAALLSSLPFPKRFVPSFIMRSFVMKGASAFTSPASVLFRSSLGRFGAWGTSLLPRAASLGGQLGRITPLGGAVITIFELANYQMPRSFNRAPQLAPADNTNIVIPFRRLK